MKKQLLWGSFSGTLQVIINTVLIFITIPIFIGKLGIQSYSIFSLLLLFNNLNVFMNLGLNTSLIKFVAEQGKSVQSNYDIAVSFTLLLLLLLPITVLTIYYNDFFLFLVFNIERQFVTSETITLFNFIIISNFFLLLGQIFCAVLDAQQKVYLNNVALILYNILYWGLILISLLQFPGFTSISYSILIATLVWFVVVFISFKKTWGSFEIHKLRENFIRTSRKQLSYGLKLYISGSISFFHEPLTKLLISHFIGLNEVAFFDIALRMKNQIWNLISRMFYPIFPLISKMNDMNSIKNLIHTVEQKTVFVIIPLMMTTIIVSKPLVTVWIGNNVNIISATMIYITCSYLLAIIVIPNYQFLMAKGYPGKTINIQILNVIINGCLFFITLPWYGYYSAVVGSVGAILSSFTLTLYYQKKHLGSLIFDDITQLGKLFLLVIYNILIGLTLSELIQINIFKIIFIPFFLIIASLFAFRTLRIFSKEEIRKFTDGEGILVRTVEKILLKN